MLKKSPENVSRFNTRRRITQKGVSPDYDSEKQETFHPTITKERKNMNLKHFDVNLEPYQTGP
jgi:hypothetical protein